MQSSKQCPDSELGTSTTKLYLNRREHNTVQPVGQYDNTRHYKDNTTSETSLRLGSCRCTITAIIARRSPSQAAPQTRPFAGARHLRLVRTVGTRRRGTRHRALVAHVRAPNPTRA
jgi:hypothetical protein